MDRCKVRKLFEAIGPQAVTCGEMRFMSDRSQRGRQHSDTIKSGCWITAMKPETATDQGCGGSGERCPVAPGSVGFYSGDRTGCHCDGAG